MAHRAVEDSIRHAVTSTTNLVISEVNVRPRERKPFGHRSSTRGHRIAAELNLDRRGRVEKWRETLEQRAFHF